MAKSADKPTTPRKPKLMEETTRIQRGSMLVASLPNGSAKLPRETTTTYDGYRRIRRHPTVAIARALGIAPVVASGWQYESDEDIPDDRVSFIRRQLDHNREIILQTAMEHGCDYGWSPWEKVFGIVQYEGRSLIGIVRWKPLLVDLTTIAVDAQSGTFAGFSQRSPSGAADLFVPSEQSLLVSFRVEGANLYGWPLLENIRNTYNQWMDSNDGACRYDRKIAGATWIVWYPQGTYTDPDGKVTDNADIAADILQRLESSGGLTIPQVVARTVADLNAGSEVNAWRVDLKEAQPKQYSFTNRLEYLDKLMVRGLLSPERVMTEGKFGDRASAEAHADLALTQRELEHRHVCRLLNWHVVDQLLAFNYGEEARGTVRIVPSPMSDSRLTTFGLIYAAMLADPVVASEVMSRIDLDSLMDALSVPKLEAVVQPVGDDEPRTGTEVVASRLRELYGRANGGNGRIHV